MAKRTEDETFRIGIDVGGTFTDIVVFSSNGEVYVHKVLSTPDDYTRGCTDGVREFFAQARSSGSTVHEVVHGTTVGTNAILQNKGAKTGLLTTEGFTDVLAIGRLRRPSLFDIHWERPKPLVPRRWRLGVPERVAVDGEELQPVDTEAVGHATAYLLEQGVESLAVCLIHSYANPEHEHVVAELLGRLAPNVPVSLSCNISPEMEEYERTSTTVINAYLTPLVGGYLRSLLTELEKIGVKAPVFVMQSTGGGVLPLEAVAARPVHIVESGPTGGVIATAKLAEEMGIKNCIPFDMGGTSAKASIIENGEFMRATEFDVSENTVTDSPFSTGGGYLIRIPVINIAEVGAGGGSIAWCDKGNVLHVGPISVGAKPGPACYSLGGEQPTVTDANVVLGLLNPEYLAGGTVPIDRGKSEVAIEQGVAEPLGLTLADAAHGIRLIANATMIRAVRAVSIERGRDPREFVFFAYGGLGPTHVADIAATLEIKKVIIPQAAGVFSSFGMLLAETQHEYVRSYLREVGQLDYDEFNRAIASVEEEALAVITSAGYGRDRVQLRRMVGLRYSGQSTDLLIPAGEGRLGPEQLRQLVTEFGHEHERTYGFDVPDEPVAVGKISAVATLMTMDGARGGRMKGKRVVAGAGAGSVSSGSRQAYFGRRLGWLQTPVLSRQQLEGVIIDGPAVVEEYDTTVVISPGCRASLDDYRNIVIEIYDWRPDGV